MLNVNLKIFRDFNNLIGRFPKSFSLLAGSCAKFLFCKGSTYPIFLLVVILIPLAIIGHSRRCRAFLYGFLFGIGYFGSTLHWIAESFYCVGLSALAYPAVSVLVLYLALYFALTFLLTAFFAKSKLQRIFFFAFFFAVFEYLRGVVFTGFPWNLISYATYQIPFVPQFADTVGSYGLSFLIVLFVGFLSNKKTFLFGIGGFSVLALYGYLKINYFDYVVPSEKFLVSIVQPSIPQEDKLNLNLFRKNLETCIALSDLNASYKGTKLIIWPEAAINVPINKPNGVLEYISSHIKYENVYIITGADFIGESKELYNGLAVIAKNGKIIHCYHKRHLLPFGEFIPNFLLNFGLNGIASGNVNYSKGNLSRTLKIPGISKFESLICFEIAFSKQIVDDKSSEWILNITNDSWFKNSDGPSQHLTTACFRAIEEGRPIIRCANNGISCVIDCNGKVLQKLWTNKVGRIETTMPRKYRNTVYSAF